MWTLTSENLLPLLTAYMYWLGKKIAEREADEYIPTLMSTVIKTVAVVVE